MSSVKSPAKLLLFAFACVFVARFCASQTNPVKEETTGITVQGVVLLEPQHLPVKKASIQLFGRRAPAPYSSVTDADGHFIIDGVIPGRYSIQVEHPGLVAAGPRMVNIMSQGTGEVLVHMQPAAVITGTITDADGDPVRNVSVMATRVSASHGWRGHDSGNGSTNDLGQFRIPDLRPGRYTVLATPGRDLPVLDATKAARGEGHLVYVPTYYPGTVDQNQSVPVGAESGQETPVNFEVLLSRAFRVSGDVLGLRSNDMAQMMLNADNKVEEQQLQPGGKFEFANLLPGSYRVQIIVFDLGNGQQPSVRVAGVNRNIEVTSEDLRDLHLQVDQGASVRGRFRVDTGEPFDWTQLTVMLANSDGTSGELVPSNGSEPPTFSTVTKDGSFEMKTVPSGKYQLVVGARGSSDKLRDYFTKSVMLNGQDVGSGFVVNSATDLEVVISAKGATIEGTVVDDKGNPVPSATVVDVPDSERSLRLDVYQQDTTDERGHFSLRGLNPGSYTVLAFEELEDSPHDPEFLTSYGSKGEKVAADEGTDKRIVLKLIPAASD